MTAGQPINFRDGKAKSWRFAYVNRWQEANRIITFASDLDPRTYPGQRVKRASQLYKFVNFLAEHLLTGNQTSLNSFETIYLTSSFKSTHHSVI